ncbi:MAG: hypothetical protein Q9208_000838 [Pyrenodesmia sp. 3 TL-2023]
MCDQNTYVVEHLDPECGPWSTLEYIAIAKESANSGAQFCLSLAPQGSELSEPLRDCEALKIEYRSVEDVYRDRKHRVCLLDPAAKEELSPKDKDEFDIFVFGGILAPLNDIPYIDHPEIRIDEHERTEMPFRYVKDTRGSPIMPEVLTPVSKGMIELIKKDSEKGFGDLL